LTLPKEGDMDLCSYLANGEADHQNSQVDFKEDMLDANLAGESNLYGERL